METANALAIIPVPKMPQLIIFSYEKPIQRPEPATIAHTDIDIKPISFSLVLPSTADKPIGFRIVNKNTKPINSALIFIQKALL